MVFGTEIPTDGGRVGGGIKLNAKLTLTTRMISAVRWEAIRGNLTFGEL